MKQLYVDVSPFGRTIALDIFGQLISTAAAKATRPGKAYGFFGKQEISALEYWIKSNILDQTMDALLKTPFMPQLGHFQK